MSSAIPSTSSFPILIRFCLNNVHFSQLYRGIHLALSLRDLPSSYWLTLSRGHAVNRNFTFCLHLGEKNSCYLPESTFRTFNLAKEAHPAQQYSWVQIPGYGHLDCIFGKSAVHDVYPHILKSLDQHAQDGLHLDESACNCVVKAVASLKYKVGKLMTYRYFQYRHNLSAAHSTPYKTQLTVH